MADKFGALELPVPPVERNGDVVLATADPALDVIADSFSAIIEHYLAESWLTAAPEEPILNKVFTHDPAAEDFSENDLPALYIFREDAAPETDYSSDEEPPLRSTIHLLWIPPPASQDKRAMRSPFFGAFAKVVKRIVQREHDPAWVSDADRALDADDPLRVTAEHYGTSILRAAGFDRWRYRDARHATVQIGKGADGKVYPGVLIRLYVTESDSTDMAAAEAAGLVAPNGVDFQLTTRTDGDSDPLVLQHGREPIPS